MSYHNEGECFYKVRDKATGLFRTGGMWAKWEKDGKRWSSLGHVKQHFSQFPVDSIKWDDWEVVEFEFSPVEAGSKTLRELL